MCWSCNPICGGCRPKRKLPAKCPTCGMYNVFDVENGVDKMECVKCGTDLAELAIPQPLKCGLCGEMCYNPCRKGLKEYEGGYETCAMRVSEPLIFDA